ncbi:hypothetical protein [Chitinimonas sp. PSY-7]|uniref:hypothetical protein n=1 Tax=Chitinimonas sp. PSY-7 TaxID=3459088 RepID=UPI00403FCFDF
MKNQRLEKLESITRRTTRLFNEVEGIVKEEQRIYSTYPEDSKTKYESLSREYLIQDLNHIAYLLKKTQRHIEESYTWVKNV